MASTIAAAGNLDVSGAAVTINTAGDTTQSSQNESQSFSGLSVALSVPGISAATTAVDDFQQASTVQRPVISRWSVPRFMQAETST